MIEGPVKTGLVQAGKYIFSHIAILFGSRIKRLFIPEFQQSD